MTTGGGSLGGSRIAEVASGLVYKQYFVYIMASGSRTLYIGVTGNLENRLAWHRSGLHPDSFTGRYNITKLVYVEDYQDPQQAIDRETQLKKWRRSKKVRLIESMNPEWRDLAPPNPSNAPIMTKNI